MTATHRTRVSLAAGPLGEADLAVSLVRGREGLSEPFRFDVDVVRAAGEPIDPADVLGASALLTFERPDGTERLVHGEISGLEMVAVNAGVPRYRASVVPALQKLAHRSGSRMFQRMTVPDVVAAVLNDRGVQHRRALSASYAVRDLCVQYRESELAFVSRLLEEEGIFYFFEHGSEEDVVVLADARGACAAIAGDATLPFRDPAAAAAAVDDGDHVDRLERAVRVRPGKASLRDFDFERPDLPLTGSCDERDDRMGLECYEYPGRLADAAAGPRLARVRLEELRFGVEVLTGAGTCPRLQPGFQFEVVHHPDEACNRELLVVRAEHEFRQQQTAGDAITHLYRNAFVALDANVPYRPRRRTSRPRAIAETARVVAPASEEILPDRHARVKVKFHWDREAAGDETSSSWIRVAQPWAGAGFGALFLPRVGQEVLVRFLDGDPDRPIIVGAIHNAQNPPPVELPEDKTRSTTRSSSSPGGGGMNELAFEDERGTENVDLHAQKDERIEVGNDKAQRVGGSESLQVAKDRTREISGAQRLDVALGDASAVGGRQVLSVTGNRETRVTGNETERVGGADTVSVLGARSVVVDVASAENVLAASALAIGAGYAVNVAGGVNEAVGALRSGQVGGNRIEIVGAAREERVNGTASFQVGGSWDSNVEGGASERTEKDRREQVGGKVAIEAKEPTQMAAKAIQLEATKLSIVVGGNEVLTIDAGGNVTFGVSKLEVNGTAIQLKGSQVKIVAAGSPGSGSAQVQALQANPPTGAVASFKLVDGRGAPVANQPFRIEFSDGTVRRGATDGSGKASVPAPASGQFKLFLPGVDQKDVSVR